MTIEKIYIGLATALFCVTLNAVVAQQAEVKVKWYPVPDTINNTIVVEMTNLSEHALPTEGWAIYFNASRMFRLGGTTQLTGRMLNGFLFQISPVKEFKPLERGKTISFKLESKDRILNISDGPAGIYIVNDKTGKSAAVSTEVPVGAVEKFMAGNPGSFDTPADIYYRNSRIKNISSEKLVKVFPTPAHYEESKRNFTFSRSIKVVADTAFAVEHEYVEKQLGDLGFTFSGGRDTVSLRYTTMPEEGYTLTVNNHHIAIEAGSNTGIFYGIQSLLTILPAEKRNTFTLPELSVTDTPRFQYRGIMVDVARNFQSKDEIKKLLAVMALYKLNVLHFHLNDDEGWRLEIPDLPELTDVGSHRGHNLNNKDYLPPAFGSGPDTSKGSGNGHYSRADFIELLRFARERHITIIPEIESPGHARAAIVSMASRYRKLMAQNKHEEAKEYLLRMPDTTAKDAEVITWWSDNVMDIKLPSTYRFIEKVIGEIQQMYQDAGVALTTIHMGGDEVSPETMNYPAPGAGWLYFWTRIDSIAQRKGLSLSGWEEMGKTTTGEGGTEPHLLNHKLAGNGNTFDVWNNVVGKDADLMGYHLANEGFKIVLSCARNNYFDMAYSRNFFESGYYWAGFIELEKTFSFTPDRYNVQLTEQGLDKKDKLSFTEFGKSNIRGIKGLLWAEKITSGVDMEYKIFPRLLALAERAWAPEPEWANANRTAAELQPIYDSAWISFVNRISQRELPRLDRYGGGIHYRIPPPGIKVANGLIHANLQFPGFVLRYTVDGSEPGARSSLYTKPIPAKGSIKFKAFSSTGRSSRTTSVTYK